MKDLNKIMTERGSCSNWCWKENIVNFLIGYACDKIFEY